MPSGSKRFKKYVYRYIKGIFVSGVWMLKKPVSKFFDLCPWITYKVYLEGFPLFSCPFPTSKVNYEKCPLPADWNRIGAYSMKRLPISISPWPCAVWWTNQVLSTETEKCNYLFFKHQTPCKQVPFSMANPKASGFTATFKSSLGIYFSSLSILLQVKTSTPPMCVCSCTTCGKTFRIFWQGYATVTLKNVNIRVTERHRHSGLWT